jgi:hypothetical protein
VLMTSWMTLKGDPVFARLLSTDWEGALSMSNCEIVVELDSGDERLRARRLPLPVDVAEEDSAAADSGRCV